MGLMSNKSSRKSTFTEKSALLKIPALHISSSSHDPSFVLSRHPSLIAEHGALL